MIQTPVQVINQLGLHARAAAKVVELAKTFAATITLAPAADGSAKPVDAKSIMAVMLLAAPQGTDLAATIDGEDEEAATAALVELFANRFGEAE